MKRTYKTSNELPKEDVDKVLKELSLGYLNLSDEMFEQAKMNFLLVLQYDKNCADAYWGMMLTKLQIQSEDELDLNPMKFKKTLDMQECKDALQYADEEQKKQYTSLLEKITKINEGDKY